MNMRIRALAAACLCATGWATAAPTYYTGTFDSDDARFVINFDVASSATLNAFTTSYAQGGFAPVLTLFGAAGGNQQVAGSASDAGSCAAGSGEFCWDARFSTSLQAGSYTLVLTQDNNFANGEQLIDGFALDGFTDYTSVFNLGYGGGKCINADATQRSCDFSLTVDLVVAGTDADGTVPEPGSLALFGAALLAAAGLRRRT